MPSTLAGKSLNEPWRFIVARHVWHRSVLVASWRPWSEHRYCRWLERSLYTHTHTTLPCLYFPLVKCDITMENNHAIHGKSISMAFYGHFPQQTVSLSKGILEELVWSWIGFVWIWFAMQLQPFTVNGGAACCKGIHHRSTGPKVRSKRFWDSEHGDLHLFTLW